ncbi:MAG: hypothetical protein ETSY1_17590 [Candidatus Entotheonella factor]|uniref:Uncharacterized protein n=1 Tax=Entotheonella factor TaxID=1429438 RepID=W4LL69_ENTF1|nr:MAG: hypothetical protein ETSY1_17590 [Candidatus Entotheonella factor]
MGEQTDRSAARRAILQQWLNEQERGPSWLARRLSYSRSYLSNVLRGYYPFADTLVRACQEHLGIDFGSMGIEKDVEESELLTAAVLTVGSPQARRQRVCSGLSTPLLYLSLPPRGRAKFSGLCMSTLSSAWKLYECVGAMERGHLYS